MKRFDISLLILFPILALLISIFWKINFLESSILFFAVPSIYLMMRNHHFLLRTLVFSLLSATFLSFFIDVLATLDKAWIVPTIFPFRIFGLASVENYVLAFFWVLFVVLFYEYFFDIKKQKKIFYGKINYLYFSFIILLLPVTVLYFSQKIQILSIPYTYAFFSLFFTLLLVCFLYSHPNSLKKFSLIACYFFFLNLLFEIAGLRNGYWIFASEHYISFIKLFKYRLPIEELLFWMIFCTPAFLAIYEYFNNDRE